MIKTLLLTDIVDSTALTEQIGDERMSKIWIEHDHIARNLLQQFDALEADRTDGFLMLFESADEACQYAIHLHQAFDELSEKEQISFKARIGIHTGDIILIETTEEHRAQGVKHFEVEGISKPTAARVMSIAIGGQTLLSKASFDQTDNTAFKSTSHGHWRMRGVAAPLELYEVGNGSTHFHPPMDSEKVYRVNLVGEVWEPVKETKHNLSKERDKFVGRKEDLHRLSDLVHDHTTQLLTILGPGGTGKTRISKRFGRMWLGDYPGGVWFCDLAECKTLEGIASAVAKALEVQLTQGEPIEHLGNAIMGRGECLIILDNFEQITGFAGQILSHWLERAPKAKFIVTSRNLLNLSGEVAMELQPLPLDKDGLLLFEIRAQERKSNFSINDENRDDVEAIIETLDGMPLAIELAAARVSVLSPSQIRERLKERFKLLTGKKDVSRRQQTLRAAIDWSWDILEEWEKSALAQCSVFEGGFTLMAAEEVIDLSAFPDAPMNMDVVQALLDKSLLRSDVQRYDVNELWFGLYVSIHEYSREKLETTDSFPGSGKDMALRVRNRHMKYFAGLGTDECIYDLYTHGSVLKRKALSDEIDNLWVGLHHAMNVKDEQHATQLLSAVWEVLKRKGPREVIKDAAEAVLELIPDNKALKAKVCGVLVDFSVWKQDFVNLDKYASLGVALCHDVNDRQAEAYILIRQAYCQVLSGNLERSIDLSQQAFSISEAVANKHLSIGALYTKANAIFRQMKLDDAGEIYREALSRTREMGDTEMEAAILDAEGSIERVRGDFKASIALNLEALSKAEEVENTFFQSNILGNLAASYMEWGDLEQAKSYLLRTLNNSRANGDIRVEARVFGFLSLCAIIEKQNDQAEEYIEKSLQIFEEIGEEQMEVLLLVNKARVMIQKADYESAADTLLKARDTSATEKTLWMIEWIEGKLCIATANYQKALEKFDNVDIKLIDLFTFKLLLFTDWTEAAIRADMNEVAKEKFNKVMDMVSAAKLFPGSHINVRIEELRDMM